MTFKPPRPGHLVHYAAIQHFVPDGQDASGQPTGTWQTVSHQYMRRDGLSGRNVEIARQLYAAATHNLYLRYDSNCNRSARIVIGDATYAVGWVDVEGNEWMRATVEESWPGVQP